jgi:tetratricopeptide (TPR) repeat protein
VKYWKGL